MNHLMIPKGSTFHCECGRHFDSELDAIKHVKDTAIESEIPKWAMEAAENLAMLFGRSGLHPLERVEGARIIAAAAPDESAAIAEAVKATVERCDVIAKSLFGFSSQGTLGWGHDGACMRISEAIRREFGIGG